MNDECGVLWLTLVQKHSNCQDSQLYLYVLILGWRQGVKLCCFFQFSIIITSYFLNINLLFDETVLWFGLVWFGLVWFDLVWLGSGTNVTWLGRKNLGLG